MARALSKHGIEMKLPWKIPDDALSENPDGSSDTSYESEENDDLTDYYDESRELQIKEYVNEWKEKMKMFVSDQINSIKLRFLERLKAIEYEVTTSYEFARKYRNKKSESLKNDTGEELKMQGTEDIVQDSIQRYQAMDTFGKETEFFQAVDSPIDINRLSVLIEYMSVTQYHDSDDVCDIDFNSLQSKFESFCMENKKASGKLNPLDVGLRTSLSEAIVHFKLLLEYFMRDMFVIPEREPETIIERQKLNRKFNSLSKLMMDYFNPLMMEKESLACEAEDFDCLKERIFQHLRKFLSMDFYDVKRIELPKINEF